MAGTGSTLFSSRLFGGSSDLMRTGSTFLSGKLLWRRLRFGGNWLHIIFCRIVLEAAQIWRELAPHFFPANCFGGGSDLAGSGSTIFSGRLFWRQLRFGRNWLHIIYRRIVFGGGSDFVGTGSKLFSSRLFWRQLRFGGNLLHIIFWRILLPAPNYLPADYFGGSSDLAGTGSTLFLMDCFGGSSDLVGTGSKLFSCRFFLKAAQIWQKLAPHYFPTDCFWRQLRFGRNWLHIIFWWNGLEAAQIWWVLAPHYLLAYYF